MGMRLRLATRQSRLALWQSEAVVQRLGKAHPDLTVDLVPVTTTGDRRQDVALSRVGGQGLFTKEVEASLLAGHADLAVHSLKDLPTEMPEGLTLAALLPREDPRDALISRSGAAFAELPAGATIGTSALRRRSQLLHARADLRIVGLRGNVETRLAKLETEALDAIVLAVAGLHRLGLRKRITEVLTDETMLPAVGQGVIAVQARSDAAEVQAWVSAIHHEPTACCAIAERAFLRALRGGCQVPVAAWAQTDGRTLALEGAIFSLDGRRRVRGLEQSRPEYAAQAGVMLAERLLQDGGAALLDEVRKA